MNDNYPMESGSVRDRLKDIRTLFIFVILSAVIALITMDIIIFPLSLFAINFTDLFNFFIRDIIWIAIAALLLFLLIRRIYLLRKNDCSGGEIARHLIVKPLSSIAVTLAVIVVALVLIYAIYLLLHYNNYLIYKINN